MKDTCYTFLWAWILHEDYQFKVKQCYDQIAFDLEALMTTLMVMMMDIWPFTKMYLSI